MIHEALLLSDADRQVLKQQFGSIVIFLTNALPAGDLSIALKYHAPDEFIDRALSQLWRNA